MGWRAPGRCRRQSAAQRVRNLTASQAASPHGDGRQQDGPECCPPHDNGAPAAPQVGLQGCLQRLVTERQVCQHRACRATGLHRCFEAEWAATPSCCTPSAAQQADRGHECSLRERSAQGSTRAQPAAGRDTAAQVATARCHARQRPGPCRRAHTQFATADTK